jgi:hypothetical protein
MPHPTQKAVKAKLQGKKARNTFTFICSVQHTSEKSMAWLLLVI